VVCPAAAGRSASQDPGRNHVGFCRGWREFRHGCGCERGADSAQSNGTFVDANFTPLVGHLASLLAMGWWRPQKTGYCIKNLQKRAIEQKRNYSSRPANNMAWSTKKFLNIRVPAGLDPRRRLGMSY